MSEEPQERSCSQRMTGRARRMTEMGVRGGGWQGKRGCDETAGGGCAWPQACATRGVHAHPRRVHGVSNVVHGGSHDVVHGGSRHVSEVSTGSLRRKDVRKCPSLPSSVPPRSSIFHSQPASQNSSRLPDGRIRSRALQSSILGHDTLDQLDQFSRLVHVDSNIATPEEFPIDVQLHTRCTSKTALTLHILIYFECATIAQGANSRGWALLHTCGIVGHCEYSLIPCRRSSFSNTLISSNFALHAFRICV